jgi:methylmalonyl-CoA mutase
MPSRPPHLDRPRPELSTWFPPHDVETWEAAALKALKGRPLSSLTTRTPSGLACAPLHPPMVGYPESGLPDAPPFVRGAGVLDRREAGWDVRQLHDAGSLVEAAQAVRDDMACGARSLWLVPDGAGRGLGGEPAEGLPLRTLDDLDAALSAVDLGAVAVHVEPGEAAAGWFAALCALGERRGIGPAGLLGAVPYDPIGVLATRGSLRSGLPAAFDALTALIEQAAQAPGVQVVGISGLPWANAGGHAVLELAGMLAQAAGVLRQVEARGGSIERTAAATLLQVSVQRDTFEELAKLRALRLLWSKLLAACGAGAAAQRANVHAVTAPTSLARRDPWVNLLRGTHGAFVAALGGADVVTVVPFDRALGAPGSLGRRVAANTQAVLEAEAHLARVADPAGGSRYVEALTDRLAREAWSVFQEVEAAGGLVAALRAGTWQSRLAAAASSRAGAVGRRSHVVLGVNLYANPGERAEVRRTVAAVAASRWRPTSGGAAIREAILAGQPIAEVGCVAGLVETVDPVPTVREAAGWEALRDTSEAWAARHGRAPRVFLATIGPLEAHKARREFATGLFEAGGFEVVTVGEPASTEALIAAFGEAEGACLCGSDEDYPAAVPALAAGLRARGAAFVAVAGRPGDHRERWREAGLGHAVFLGGDVLAELRSMLAAAGVV